MRLTIIFLASFISLTTFARSDESSFSLAGAGSMSCEKYLEGRGLQNDTVNSLFSTWMQGFLSGLNIQRYQLTKQPMVKIPDAKALLEELDKSCKTKPQPMIFVIGMEYFQRLSQQ